MSSKKKRLAKGRRIEIRRQKAEIRKTSKSKDEADQKIKELLERAYK